MPETEEHFKLSKDKFGKDGKEYHKWLDQYFPSFNKHEHRKVLHNREGVEVGVQLFGEKARLHLEQHIKDDYGKDTIPKIKDLRRSNGKRN